MCRIVEEDLRYNSCTIKVRQMLSEAARTKRVERYNLLLCSLRNNAVGRLRFFSDEKIVTVDAKINQRNDRWLAHDPEDVPIVFRTKFPANVRVLSVVSSEVDAMPPHFFNTGENGTKEVYLRVLTNVMKPWMETGEKLVRKAVCFPTGPAHPHKSFGSKLVVRQCRHVLVQRILTSQQPRLKSLRLLCIELG